MTPELTLLKKVVDSESYPTLMSMGLISPLAFRNLRMVEMYLSLTKAGTGNLAATDEVASVFKCCRATVYNVRRQLGVEAISGER
jgi:hypothetical protein